MSLAVNIDKQGFRGAFLGIAAARIKWRPEADQPDWVHPLANDLLANNIGIGSGSPKASWCRVLRTGKQTANLPISTMRPKYITITCRDMLHHRQVVGNKQICKAKLLLQVVQEIQNLGLNRDVQRRYRLIADNKGGFKDSALNPLPLPAAELMGKRFI